MSIDRTMIEIAISCDLYEHAKNQCMTRQYDNLSDYIADLIRKDTGIDRIPAHSELRSDSLTGSKLVNNESLDLDEQRGTEIHADVRDLLRRAATENVD